MFLPLGKEVTFHTLDSYDCPQLKGTNAYLRGNSSGALEYVLKLAKYSS